MNRKYVISLSSLLIFLAGFLAGVVLFQLTKPYLAIPLDNAALALFWATLAAFFGISLLWIVKE